MASHIILPPDDADENHNHQAAAEEREELGRDDDDDEHGPPPGLPPKAALPFSATWVRISRDSYPNLRALRNASSVSLADAAYVKISEGDFGYVLDDVPHFTDYLPDIPVSAGNRSPPAARLPPPCLCRGDFFGLGCCALVREVASQPVDGLCAVRFCSLAIFVASRSN